MRTSVKKNIQNIELFKQKIVCWAQQFREIVFLDSHSFVDKYSSYDVILAVDAFTSLQTDYYHAFEDLKQYQQTTKDWLFGYLSYDLKNDCEALESKNLDGLGFPDLFFFQPKKLFLLKGNELQILYLNCCDDELDDDFNAIGQMQILAANKTEKVEIQSRISKAVYLEKIQQILRHLGQGSIYEINFCMEFFGNAVSIDPLEKFQKLKQISPVPFSVFFKNNSNFLLCASPERFLKKTGENLFSQPIKGTAPRFLNEIEDETSKNNLKNDPKERAENIMITDLVRNDLARTAQKGSVQVAELCGIYSFAQVHQMISTISSKLDPNFSSVDAIRYAFPMGSMTGAPKIKAMKIIEELEESKRGLYSGAVGYFTPEADFDFNVVIRSILYNQKSKYLSFSVGSAITALSDPEKEYQECLLKAKAMQEVFE